jgi:hypothetical protein
MFAVPIEEAADGWIGLAFDTWSAPGPISLEEIVLDAKLAAADPCGQGAFNVALWDVTDPLRPALVSGLRLQTSSRNLRSHLPVSLTLQPSREYRVVAHVSQYRQTALAAVAADGGLAVQGGLAYKDSNSCNGQRAARANYDPALTAIALRYRKVPASLAVDPVGSSLRLAKAAGNEELLHWNDVGAPAYRILRCDASVGACVPAPVALSTLTSYAEGDEISIPALPRELEWYLVDAVNACDAGL